MVCSGGAWGLAQGDPFLSYHFVLIMELLLAILKKRISLLAEFQVQWKCKEVNLFMLSFADDLFFFCKASKNSVVMLMEAFQLFSHWATIFLLPFGVTKLIERRIRKLLWAGRGDRGAARFAWEHILQTCAAGGLRLRSLANAEARTIVDVPSSHDACSCNRPFWRVSNVWRPILWSQDMEKWRATQIICPNPQPVQWSSHLHVPLSIPSITFILCLYRKARRSPPITTTTATQLTSFRPTINNFGTQIGGLMANLIEEDEGMVNITVRTIGPSPPSHLRVPSSLKVKELRELIAGTSHLPLKNMRLVCRGNVLHDSTNGDDILVQLQDGETVFVAIKPQPPAKHISNFDDDDGEDL
ncbi:UNVERIFIED_CONTAM: hypothetical protein Sindi_2581600, partial [Sesamum indicum]